GEFIELFNPSAKTVPLQGCAVWVNDARRYIFSETNTVAPKAWFVLAKAVSGLSLTNTGGMVTLKDADGTLLDTITYPQSIENQAWARLGSAWGWTNQTT